jgi:hypothetical protein
LFAAMAAAARGFVAFGAWRTPLRNRLTTHWLSDHRRTTN